MQLARVVGHATSTVKHETLTGWRLCVVQILDQSGNADGFPQLAVDSIGSRCGDDVMITSDGKAVRQLIGANNTPVRWSVIGILDESPVSK